MAGRASRKSYEQYCPVARTLDVVGERWTLLVIRELMMGPKRYTDLRAGLPGIPTDVLTSRLRTLEEAGYARRRELPRPAPATVYELTDGGQPLRRVIFALGQVGMAGLAGPERGEDIQGERLVLALRISFRRERFADLSEIYDLTIDGEPFTAEVRDGQVETRPGTAPNAAVSLRTDALTFDALLRGELTAADALSEGRAVLDGERKALNRFLEAFSFRSSDTA